MPKEGEFCEYRLKCAGANENCVYGNRLAIRKDGYAEGCTMHDDHEIIDLERELESMTQDGIPENSTEAFKTYSKMSARLKELKGQ